MISTNDSGFVLLGFNEVVKSFLHKDLDIQFQCGLYVSTSVLVGILNGVKNAILEWTLTLEKSGIVGEGMTFSKNEIERAQNVTNHFYNSNVGVVGSVSGDANNSKFYTKVGDVDNSKIIDLVSKIRDALPALPPHVATSLKEPIAQLESGAKAGNKSLVSAAFGSIRNLLEGAGGNLAAAGIISALGGA